MLRLFFSFLLLFSLPAQAESFLAGFEDIPMMQGMHQLENEVFSFGNEEARYIETSVTLSYSDTFVSVKKFYQKTLTQLGWIEQKQDKDFIYFYRENDILEIRQVAETPLKINIILKNRN